MRHQFDQFAAEFKDAVAGRTVALIIGTLLLQLAFIASYVGAFHAPQAHGVSVGVVGPTSAATQVVDQLRSSAGDRVDAKAVASRAAAVDAIRGRDLDAAVVLDTSGTKDELLVASGGGTSIVTVVEQAATSYEGAQGRTYTTTDVVPLESGDARGLSGFYLVIGWLIGGYLVASLLGVAKGARPANTRRAMIRLAATVPYAVVAGLGGALIVDQWLGALTGHFWALAGVGVLTVLAAATVTIALQVLFGTLGIGLTVLLFVVLGNPSAGGAFQWELLPSLWRGIGPWLPNGAGTEAIRRIIYFGGTGVAAYLLVIAAYACVGVALTTVGSLGHARQTATHVEA